jgi:hypothetical protein
MSPSADARLTDLPTNTIEAQIRECFGRVVYTHKTHEKQADILAKWRHTLSVAQIVLAAIGSGSFIATLFGNGPIGAAVGSVVSLLLLTLNAYTKAHDLGALAQQHKQAASDLWLVREQYFSLLTDLRLGLLSMDDVTARRDELMLHLQEVQQGAPATTPKAYAQAQTALKDRQDLTFSDSEIDAFLPGPLRKTER